jgi:hypothetical protein
MKKGKKSWFGNVGYWGVLAAVLWMQSASANVTIKTFSGYDTGTNYGMNNADSCPIYQKRTLNCDVGYVIVSIFTATGAFSSVDVTPTASSIVQPATGYQSDSWSGGCKYPTVHLFCAKVCN